MHLVFREVFDHLTGGIAGTEEQGFALTETPVAADTHTAAAPSSS